MMDSSKSFLERCTSLGIYGGTFDPIHNGHLAIAESALHQFNLQKVLFVPACEPPHKPDKHITEGEHRYQMVLQSIARIPGLEVTRLELERMGKSYTIDTINELKKLCPSAEKIYFIIGQDALEGILNWKNASELLTACEFIAVLRPGYNQELFRSNVQMLNEKYNAIIHLLDTIPLDISSTAVRGELMKGNSVLIPEEAATYIYMNELYGSGFLLSQQHFEWVEKRLQARLSPRRFLHSMGVVIEAEKLALHYGADVKKARWAALLHDCTKEYSADKKRTLCAQWEIELDELLYEHIDLAHGLLGAEAAKRNYYVDDSEILQAIRYHISGHGNATLLDKIIVLADFIEQYRDDYYPLQEMRDIAYNDIDKALLLGLKTMRDIDEARGKKLHHWSKDCINLLEGSM